MSTDQGIFEWAAGESSRVLPVPVPPAHTPLDSAREALERVHWVASEIDLHSDRDSLVQLEARCPGVRRMVQSVLSFFAHFDLLVLAGFEDGLGRLADCVEARAFYAAQVAQEEVHARAYGLQLLAVLDPAEIASAEAALRGSGAIAAMAAWARGALAPTAPGGERLVALALVEGVLFCSSFASLQWLKERNALPGVVALNEFIARDETLHSAFSCLLVRRYLRAAARPAATRVHAITREAVAAADAFIDEALPAPLPGLTRGELRTYVRAQADFVLGEMGYGALYGAANPFAFMTKLGLNSVGKTNFFERDVTAYQAPGRATFTVDLATDYLSDGSE